MVAKISFYSEASPVWAVPRTALIKKMKSASAKKNIFLSAPGGYGKTIAAAQWLSSVHGKTLRLVAGDADNDPGFFYKRLAAAWLKLTEKETNRKTIPDTAVSFDRLLEIIRRLPSKNARCYFVLDDLHTVKNEEIMQALPLIAASWPGYMRCCLASRSEPTEALLATGLFEIMTQDDLLFSSEEVQWLGAEKDLDLTGDQVNDLLETTGGWAIYVSALLSAGEAPERIGTDAIPQMLASYLDAKIWEPWDRETKTLLLRLAVPAEITPTLAERLTGRTDGCGLLAGLMKKGNAFLSLEGADTYRFHDLFRDFLLKRLDDFLGRDEVRKLNDIAAEWHYGQGDYYAGAKHYIHNNDHEGIRRCLEATVRFHAETGAISMETRLNFVKQYVLDLSSEFIGQNPYLICKCASVAFHDGNTTDYLKYIDLLRQKMPEIYTNHPELVEHIVFLNGLDFRLPLKRFIELVAESMPPIHLDSDFRRVAKTVTITQNLPFYHRSMRDYSEYYELKEEDLALVRATFGLMIGDDYDSMEHSIIAGIYYERGELLEAVRHAIEARRACGDGTHPETVFSADMILAATLYAMGASQEATEIMRQAEDFIESQAQFLRQNFKALRTERAIRDGHTEAAREWLAAHANSSNRLPFYQICRHFVTLRSYMAVKDYAAAAAFGARLSILAAEYKRPLDQIESGLLTALALWRGGEKKSAGQLEEAVNLARPYGFTQLFINEGKEILPLLWALRKNKGKPDAFTRFADNLIEGIYKKHDLKPDEGTRPRLSEQQRAMLPYLNQGLTYKEIAEAAGLGRGTVKSHILLVYKRLGARNAQEAVMKAKRLGLWDRPLD